MRRGVVIAPGAGLLKTGENGRGLESRWYPQTLVRRIWTLRGIRSRITFEKIDAFKLIQRFANQSDVVFFIDPPYTAGGQNPGSRLYTHYKIDHDKLLALAVRVKGSVIATYNDTPEVRALAVRYGFSVAWIPMKTTNHKVVYELVLARNNKNSPTVYHESRWGC